MDEGDLRKHLKAMQKRNQRRDVKGTRYRCYFSQSENWGDFQAGVKTGDVSAPGLYLVGKHTVADSTQAGPRDDPPCQSSVRC